MRLEELESNIPKDHVIPVMNAQEDASDKSLSQEDGLGNEKKRRRNKKRSRGSKTSYDHTQVVDSSSKKTKAIKKSESAVLRAEIKINSNDPQYEKAIASKLTEEERLKKNNVVESAVQESPLIIEKAVNSEDQISRGNERLEDLSGNSERSGLVFVHNQENKQEFVEDGRVVVEKTMRKEKGTRERKEQVDKDNFAMTLNIEQLVQENHELKTSLDAIKAEMFENESIRTNLRQCEMQVEEATVRVAALESELEKERLQKQNFEKTSESWKCEMDLIKSELATERQLRANREIELEDQILQLKTQAESVEKLKNSEWSKEKDQIDSLKRQMEQELQLKMRMEKQLEKLQEEKRINQKQLEDGNRALVSTLEACKLELESLKDEQVKERSDPLELEIQPERVSNVGSTPESRESETLLCLRTELEHLSTENQRLVASLESSNQELGSVERSAKSYLQQIQLLNSQLEHNQHSLEEQSKLRENAELRNRDLITQVQVKIQELATLKNEIVSLNKNSSSELATEKQLRANREIELENQILQQKTQAETVEKTKNSELSELNDRIDSLKRQMEQELQSKIKMEKRLEELQEEKRLNLQQLDDENRALVSTLEACKLELESLKEERAKERSDPLELEIQPERVSNVGSAPESRESETLLCLRTEMEHLSTKNQSLVASLESSNQELEKAKQNAQSQLQQVQKLNSQLEQNQHLQVEESKLRENVEEHNRELMTQMQVQIQELATLKNEIVTLKSTLVEEGSIRSNLEGQLLDMQSEHSSTLEIREEFIRLKQMLIEDFEVKDTNDATTLHFRPNELFRKIKCVFDELSDKNRRFETLSNEMQSENLFLKNQLSTPVNETLQKIQMDLSNALASESRMKLDLQTKCQEIVLLKKDLQDITQECKNLKRISEKCHVDSSSDDCQDETCESKEKQKRKKKKKRCRGQKGIPLLDSQNNSRVETLEGIIRKRDEEIEMLQSELQEIRRESEDENVGDDEDVQTGETKRRKKKKRSRGAKVNVTELQNLLHSAKDQEKLLKYRIEGQSNEIHKLKQKLDQNQKSVEDKKALEQNLLTSESTVEELRVKLAKIGDESEKMEEQVFVKQSLIENLQTEINSLQLQLRLSNASTFEDAEAHLRISKDSNDQVDIESEEKNRRRRKKKKRCRVVNSAKSDATQMKRSTPDHTCVDSLNEKTSLPKSEFEKQRPNEIQNLENVNSYLKDSLRDISAENENLKLRLEELLQKMDPSELEIQPECVSHVGSAPESRESETLLCLRTEMERLSTENRSLVASLESSNQELQEAKQSAQSQLLQIQKLNSQLEQNQNSLEEESKLRDNVEQQKRDLMTQLQVKIQELAALKNEIVVQNRNSSSEVEKLKSTSLEEARIPSDLEMQLVDMQRELSSMAEIKEELFRLKQLDDPANDQVETLKRSLENELQNVHVLKMTNESLTQANDALRSRLGLEISQNFDNNEYMSEVKEELEESDNDQDVSDVKKRRRKKKRSRGLKMSVHSKSEKISNVKNESTSDREEIEKMEENFPKLERFEAAKLKGHLDQSATLQEELELLKAQLNKQTQRVESLSEENNTLRSRLDKTQVEPHISQSVDFELEASASQVERKVSEESENVEHEENEAGERKRRKRKKRSRGSSVIIGWKKEDESRQQEDENLSVENPRQLVELKMKIKELEKENLALEKKLVKLEAGIRGSAMPDREIESLKLQIEQAFEREEKMTRENEKLRSQLEEISVGSRLIAVANQELGNESSGDQRDEKESERKKTRKNKKRSTRSGAEFHLTEIVEDPEQTALESLDKDRLVQENHVLKTSLDALKAEVVENESIKSKLGELETQVEEATVNVAFLESELEKERRERQNLAKMNDSWKCEMDSIKSELAMEKQHRANREIELEDQILQLKIQAESVEKLKNSESSEEKDRIDSLRRQMEQEVQLKMQIEDRNRALVSTLEACKLELESLKEQQVKERSDPVELEIQPERVSHVGSTPQSQESETLLSLRTEMEHLSSENQSLVASLESSNQELEKVKQSAQSHLQEAQLLNSKLEQNQHSLEEESKIRENVELRNRDLETQLQVTLQELATLKNQVVALNENYTSELATEKQFRANREIELEDQILQLKSQTETVDRTKNSELSQLNDQIDTFNRQMEQELQSKIKMEKRLEELQEEKRINLQQLEDENRALVSTLEACKLELESLKEERIEMEHLSTENQSLVASLESSNQELEKAKQNAQSQLQQVQNLNSQLEQKRHSLEKETKLRENVDQQNRELMTKLQVQTDLIATLKNEIMALNEHSASEVEKLKSTSLEEARIRSDLEMQLVDMQRELSSMAEIKEELFRLKQLQDEQNDSEIIEEEIIQDTLTKSTSTPVNIAYPHDRLDSKNKANEMLNSESGSVRDNSAKLNNQFGVNLNEMKCDNDFLRRQSDAIQSKLDHIEQEPSNKISDNLPESTTEYLSVLHNETWINRVECRLSELDTLLAKLEDKRLVSELDDVYDHVYDKLMRLVKKIDSCVSSLIMLSSNKDERLVSPDEFEDVKRQLTSALSRIDCLVAHSQEKENELSDQCDFLEQGNKMLQEENFGMREKLQQLEKLCSTQSHEMDYLNNEIDDLKEKIDDLEAKLQSARSKETRRTEELEQTRLLVDQLQDESCTIQKDEHISDLEQRLQIKEDLIVRLNTSAIEMESQASRLKLLLQTSLGGLNQQLPCLIDDRLFEDSFLEEISHSVQATQKNQDFDMLKSERDRLLVILGHVRDHKMSSTQATESLLKKALQRLTGETNDLNLEQIATELDDRVAQLLLEKETALSKMDSLIGKSDTNKNNKAALYMCVCNDKNRENCLVCCVDEIRRKIRAEENHDKRQYCSPSRRRYRDRRGDAYECRKVEKVQCNADYGCNCKMCNETTQLVQAKLQELQQLTRCSKGRENCIYREMRKLKDKLNDLEVVLQKEHELKLKYQEQERELAEYSRLEHRDSRSKAPKNESGLEPKEPTHHRSSGPRDPMQRRDSGPKDSTQQRGSGPKDPIQLRDSVPRYPIEQRDSGPKDSLQQRDSGPKDPIERKDSGPKDSTQLRDSGPKDPIQQGGSRPKDPTQQRGSGPEDTPQQIGTGPMQRRESWPKELVLESVYVREVGVEEPGDYKYSH
ncbi:hypothetical protein Ciccas_006053 [Cichlidogyrus casuarinus]|uniref:Uncharacterized protein n=1 Tax=Cichlidogyrus casuarinus TaxID=1844966 RepID=A0ABD2QAP4_9PLAT